MTRFQFPQIRAVSAAIVATILSLDAAHSAVAETKAPGALALYGNTIEFDVFRKGKAVGTHRIRLSGSDENLKVDVQFQLQIKLLLVTAYEFTYRSEAVWRREALARLDVSVDDGGKLTTVQAAGDGARMTVKANGKSYTTSAPLFPTNHWNAAVLNQNRVLNTITGNVNKVRIKSAGRDRVRTERGEIFATRYVYSGDIKTEAWYDDAGRWVKLRFKAKDGSIVDYVCRRCQGGSLAAAKS